MTFATCLADEYAYIYATLIRMGVTSTEALRWIDEVRQIGWNSRFTIPTTADTEVLETILNEM